MAKKVVVGLILVMIVTGGAFAQKSASAKKNWISGEVGLLGAGLRYERMLGEKLSLGVDAYWQSTFFIWNDMGAVVAARLYPWGGIFFAELGLGFNYHTGTGTYEYEYEILGRKFTEESIGLMATTGVGIVPGIGWKIDVGKPGGFFLTPQIHLPLTLGVKKPTFTVYGDPEGKFGFGFGFRASLGLGFAF
jgi:hypothetical protein